ncbi:hypothetical protein M3Y94_00380100 [Aphelenchoides besseyi]|nr:hypothetical protein M3Y94_00380100 [Aphelenchoides besseyi]
MGLTRQQIRLLLLHEYRLHHKATVAAVNINAVHGTRTTSERTAQRWFVKFDNGIDNLEDQPRQGRPSTVDRLAILNSVVANPVQTVRELANVCCHVSVWRTLRKPGKRFLC